jgi:sortase A
MALEKKEQSALKRKLVKFVTPLLEDVEIAEIIESKEGGYSTEAIISIPSIGISYPVLSETTDELLEISVNKYWGPKPNEVGNYCIVGHNYKNGKMFGRLSELVNGDIVELEDLSGKMVKYKVYNRYVVKPTDTSCTSQLTNGKKELTLITCTNYGKDRLVIKCRAL